VDPFFRTLYTMWLHIFNQRNRIEDGNWMQQAVTVVF
jgi:hypothetical protein